MLKCLHFSSFLYWKVGRKSVVWAVFLLNISAQKDVYKLKQKSDLRSLGIGINVSRTNFNDMKSRLKIYGQYILTKSSRARRMYIDSVLYNLLRDLSPKKGCAHRLKSCNFEANYNKQNCGGKEVWPFVKSTHTHTERESTHSHRTNIEKSHTSSVSQGSILKMLT